MSDGARDLTTAIGAISGTSMDGIDVALIRSDGEARVEAGPARDLSLPCRGRGRAARGRRRPGARGGAARRARSRRHRRACRGGRALPRATSPSTGASVEIVGLHGQTVLHRPRERFTRQLCDGARAAAALAIDVVSDFRSADVAAGGEGAPLAPLYHAAMARRSTSRSWSSTGAASATSPSSGRSGEIVAFDTGPANALIDDFCRGAAGAASTRTAGSPRPAASTSGARRALMRDPYFDRPPPKSLDRNHFAAAARAVERLSDADGAATLAAFTVEATAAAARISPCRRSAGWSAAAVG